ncbi:hypothetical protein [Salipaludibacillus daqingensis]|uniref:hypothetical protein n=1 Tax=Salipaludibacillus daqingensis TaxID=3041001 RepID=UPI0024754BE5|nr:hypothetical protein [Salipaludibacillus daqingensis]
MRRSIDYIFIFLIGYQVYFLTFMLFTPASNQMISLGVSFIGVLLSVIVWMNKGSLYSKKHVNMATTTGILSASSIIIYILDSFHLLI